MNTSDPRHPLNLHALVTAVADETGAPPRQTEQIISAFMDVVVRTVTTGGAVTVTNFGSFHAVERPARAARNPQNGERIQLPATRQMRFRVAPRARQIVAAGDPSASRRKRPRRH
ncbi:HU family DNA-binding protein [Streptomyces sp. MP131-18]|uniref:HU family DNA-binding protein n=1 Tax=Streptomyces sp. MP131-18 TaxID=1857892 RepID=UPI00097C7163|nr:HU family DNA-binding protein [Streptomyces sp. MP131-18]ONK13088.1 DNA-binding protein HU [Streptomyces sp. MP131-18]